MTDERIDKRMVLPYTISGVTDYMFASVAKRFSVKPYQNIDYKTDFGGKVFSANICLYRLLKESLEYNENNDKRSNELFKN